MGKIKTRVNIVVKCPKCKGNIEMIIETVNEKTYYIYKCDNEKCEYELGRKLLRIKK